MGICCFPTRVRPPSPDALLEQRIKIQRWAAEQRAEVVAVYEDQEDFGVLGHRPENVRMLADARAHQRSFDAIAVTNLDRLTRSVCELSKLESELKGLGVSLIATEQLPPTEWEAIRRRMSPYLD